MDARLQQRARPSARQNHAPVAQWAAGAHQCSCSSYRSAREEARHSQRAARRHRGHWTVANAAKSQTVSVAAPSPSSGEVPKAMTYAVTASTVYAGVLFLAMIFFPRVEAVKRAMKSYWLFAPLAIVYTVLMLNAWTPDTLSTLMPGSLAAGFAGGFNPQFFPSLDGISTLFSRPATAASFLLHIIAINLFLGRRIYLDGLVCGVPTWHSLIIASAFGPLALLVHWLTRAIWASVGPKTQVLNSGNGGQITLLPYDK